MRIREGNEWKSAFKTRYSYFKYQLMPYRLTNAPVIFQGYINNIFVKKLYVFVIMYLEDVFIYSESKREEYMQTMKWVLE